MDAKTTASPQKYYSPPFTARERLILFLFLLIILKTAKSLLTTDP